ncbi:MAG: helix-turn-helix domain-containing protein [Paracoccaceae bacterium]
MTGTQRTRANFSTTLDKGMKILAAFNERETHLTNQQIAERIGVSRPTVARLTSTLVELGYMKKDKARFRLSWRMVPLANPLRGKNHAIESADAAMKRIANEFGGAASIGTIDRLNFMYLKTVRSRENIWGGPDIGTVGRILPTSIGWALCSLMTDEELGVFVEEVKAATPETWERHGADFRLGVESCRTLGSCKSSGALHPDIDAVAAPLLRDDNGDCFAVNFRAPRYMLGVNQIEEEIAPRLRSLATAIRDMGQLVRPAGP